MLAEGEQQRVEDQQRNPDEHVLHWMDGRLAAVLDEENRGEGEEDEQVGVFDGTRRLLVLHHRHPHDHPELVVTLAHAMCALATVIAPFRHRLREIAVESQHLPRGREASVAHRALLRQEIALEARCATIGGQLHGRAVADWQEHDALRALQRHSHGIRHRLVALQLRQRDAAAEHRLQLPVLVGFHRVILTVQVQNDILRQPAEVA